MSEWISVKDRLPEPFVSVLIFVPSEPSPIFEAYYVSKGVFNATNIMHGNYGFLKVGDAVTHWMPMPDPPEVEGEKDE